MVLTFFIEKQVAQKRQSFADDTGKKIWYTVII